jgi:hypothetical protein
MYVCNICPHKIADTEMIWTPYIQELGVGLIEENGIGISWQCLFEVTDEELAQLQVDILDKNSEGKKSEGTSTRKNLTWCFQLWNSFIGDFLLDIFETF